MRSRSCVVCLETSPSQESSADTRVPETYRRLEVSRSLSETSPQNVVSPRADTFSLTLSVSFSSKFNDLSYFVVGGPAQSGLLSPRVVEEPPLELRPECRVRVVSVSKGLCEGSGIRMTV